MGGKAVEKLGEKKERAAGVLVHPTSFPSPHGIGDLGEGAYQFVDFLKEAGQKIWQILPLGPTGYGDSPYQSFSSFAGQPLIISLQELVKDGFLYEDDFADIPKWKDDKVDFGPVITYKNDMLHKAYERFREKASKTVEKTFGAFCEKESYWLEDYALFMAGKDAHGGDSWLEWEDDLRDPDESVKEKWKKELEVSVTYYKFIQFIFFRQWFALKRYANKKGISIVGDIPIFVAMDSADVWANKHLFQLDSKGYPIVVAGVPPDYFSKTGQLWGNPLYDWDEMKQDGYQWWLNRIRGQFTLVDYLRIDHFRGFEAYWAVPYGQKTAIKGKWRKGPYKELFFAIQKELGKQLPIFAEDLGVITPRVETLRDSFGFPGMKILQFAFEGTAENIFLPHYYTENCICYTGTHDNDTTVGWYEKIPAKSKKKCQEYMNAKSDKAEDICWDFIRAAYASTARYAVVPVQDLLCKDGESRMNTPSTASGNWEYRYQKNELTKELAKKMKNMAKVYGR